MNIIQKWLVDNERTAEYLARKAGMTAPAIRSYVNGTSKPTLKSVVKLVAATGLPVEAIVSWEVEPEQ